MEKNNKKTWESKHDHVISMFVGRFYEIVVVTAIGEGQSSPVSGHSPL